MKRVNKTDGYHEYLGTSGWYYLYFKGTIASKPWLDFLLIFPDVDGANL